MSEEPTKELVAIEAMHKQLLALAFDVNQRLEKLEAKTTPLQSLLEELVSGQQEIRRDFAFLKSYILKTKGELDYRLHQLEEAHEREN